MRIRAGGRTTKFDTAIFALAALLLSACTADDEPVKEATQAPSVAAVVAASSLDAATSCEQLVVTYLASHGGRVATISSGGASGAEPDPAAFAPGDAETDADAAAARLGCSGPDIAALLCEKSVVLDETAAEEQVPAVCR